MASSDKPSIRFKSKIPNGNFNEESTNPNFLTAIHRFSNGLKRSITVNNTSVINKIVDGRLSPHQFLERNFISNFKVLKPIFESSKIFLSKYQSGKKNPLLSSRSRGFTGSPKFSVIAERIINTQIGKTVSSLPIKLDKNEVRSKNLQGIDRYTDRNKNQFFGTHYDLGTQIKVDLILLAKSATKTANDMLGTDLPEPINKDYIIEDILSKSTSSGFPYFEKKNELDKQEIHELVDLLITDFSPRILLQLGTSLGIRHQVGRDGNSIYYECKVRIIFVVDLFFLILQALIFGPVLKRFQSRVIYHPSSAAGMNEHQLQVIVHNLRMKALDYNCDLINIDMSKFDTSIKPYLKLSFYICMYPYCLTQFPIFGSLLNFNLIYWTVAILSTYQTIYYEGESYVTNGSTLSGEYITSFSNTFYHILVLNYYSLYYNVSIDTSSFTPDVCVLGDDGLYLGRNIDIDKFESIVNDLGLTVGDDWDYFHPLSNEVYFLGRYYDQYSRPYQNKFWFEAHSTYAGGFNPNFRMSDYITIRNCTFALGLSNSKFAISCLGKYDRKLGEILEQYKNSNISTRDSIVTQVLDYYGNVFCIKLHDLINYGETFPKYEHRYVALEFVTTTTLSRKQVEF